MKTIEVIYVYAQIIIKMNIYDTDYTGHSYANAINYLSVLCVETRILM